MPFANRIRLPPAPGKVQLVFDGKREVELCVLERIEICIDGVKNPFDDCQEPATTP